MCINLFRINETTRGRAVACLGANHCCRTFAERSSRRSNCSALLCQLSVSVDGSRCGVARREDAAEFVPNGSLPLLQLIHPKNFSPRNVRASTGISITKLVPFSSELSTKQLPPWLAATAHAKDSPMPQPSFLHCLEACALV